MTICLIYVRKSGWYGIRSRAVKLITTKNNKNMGLNKYNTNDYRPTSFRSFVDNFFTDEFNGGSTPSFSPKVDIAESENEFEVQLHVSGIKKEEINIDLDEKQLTISGERKREDIKDDKNFHRVESYFGSFSRSFHLPDAVDQDKIEASYEDGILTVKLPKDQKKLAKKQILIK